MWISQNERGPLAYGGSSCSEERPTSEWSIRGACEALSNGVADQRVPRHRRVGMSVHNVKDKTRYLCADT